MRQEKDWKPEESLEIEAGYQRNRKAGEKIIVGSLSLTWALFQLALPRFIILDSLTVRAVHLAFAIALIFLTIPLFKKRPEITFLNSKDHVPLFDYFLAILACLSVLYIVLDWKGISMRAGIPLERDMMISAVLIILLLEASRRVIGPALSFICILLTLYAFLGPYLPPILAYRGASLSKYLSQIALSTEGIYGIPLDVSANTVFMFVLLGSMLDRVGAGRFFNNLAISLLGQYKGGPAKSAVVASGLTGLISGSSIANIVTTGTFTIPLMKKVGYPPKVAAATEVAASTDGQLMPPMMGAAAFIIAEYLSLPYIDVIKAAAIPAFVSYFALFYITHLEASKRGMKGLPKSELPAFGAVLKSGFHYLIPLFILIYELIFIRHTPKLAAFNAILSLIAIILVQEIIRGYKERTGILTIAWSFLKTTAEGMIAGSRNMLSVAIATATAGIVVGIVTMGIGSMIVHIVEVLSYGNIFLILIITAIASLILGMGLPTTATYIVMASITVPVIVNLSTLSHIIVIPAIAAHLFCFYFGILADDTPPVGLAAYTAAAIAKSDPIETGIQGFLYDLRTVVIPFMFVLNSELILYEINSLPQALLIFTMAVFGAFAFTNAVQGWFVIKNRWFEIPLLLAASLILFNPGILTKLFNLDHQLRYYMYFIGMAVYCLAYLIQKTRQRSQEV